MEVSGVGGGVKLVPRPIITCLRYTGRHQSTWRPTQVIAITDEIAAPIFTISGHIVLPGMIKKAPGHEPGVGAQSAVGFPGAKKLSARNLYRDPSWPGPLL